MRVWIFSDLHLEHDPAFDGFTPPDAELCICAGDLADGGIVPSILWLVKHVLPSMPVIFVCGNHEYYGSSICDAHFAAREARRKHHKLHLLNGESVELDGFRFFGVTLWTDFEILGDQRIARFEAGKQLNDFKRIKLSKRPFRRFSPMESQYLHRRAVSDIDSFYQSSSEKPTVVVSHHAPSLRSIPAELARDPLTPAFASNLEARISKYAPVLWVHGHVHWPSDYIIGRTRVVCNPRGYPSEPSRKFFVPDMVIDLAKYAC